MKKSSPKKREQPSKAATPLPVTLVSLGLIDPSPLNRTVADADELVASVKEHGVQQPIKLRPVGERYEIVYGERRFRAAQQAKLSEIPATVEDLTEDEAHELRVLENAARKDPHPLEQAEAWERLLQARDAKGRPVHTPQTIAQLIGASPQLVYSRLQLTNLVPELRRAVFEKRLSVSGAFLVARSIPPALQPEAWERMAAYLADECDESELNDEGQLTVQAIGRFIDAEYTFDLKTARFPLDAKLGELLPCATCRRRSSAQPHLFVDIENGKDTCLDVACFKAKAAAWVDEQKRAVLAMGGRVMSEEESRRSFQGGSHLPWNSPWVDLDGPCFEHPERPTWRALLGDLCPAPVLAFTVHRAAVQLTSRSEALEVLRHNGLLPSSVEGAEQRSAAPCGVSGGEVVSGTATPTVADEASARRIQRFEALVGRATRARLFESLVAGAEGAAPDDNRFVELALQTVLRGGYFNAIADVVKRRGPDAPKGERSEATLQRLIETLSPMQLRGLLLELCVARMTSSYSWGGDGLPEHLARALAAYGVDERAVAEDLRAELTAAQDLKKAG